MKQLLTMPAKYGECARRTDRFRMERTILSSTPAFDGGTTGSCSTVSVSTCRRTSWASYARRSQRTSFLSSSDKPLGASCARRYKALARYVRSEEEDCL